MAEDDIEKLPELEIERGFREKATISLPQLELIRDAIKLPNIERVKFGVDPGTGELTFFEMTTHEPPPPPAPSTTWMIIPALFFCALTIVTLTLLMTGTIPTVQKTIYFNVWVAMCVAASVGFLGGEATATGKLPMPAFLGDNPITFTVAGGIATFIIVLILMVSMNSV